MFPNSVSPLEVVEHEMGALHFLPMALTNLHVVLEQHLSRVYAYQFHLLLKESNEDESLHEHGADIQDEEL